MSYEGYYQLLCLNGHLVHDNDIYNYDDTSERKCPTCNAGYAFENAVDQTNNPRDGFIDFEKHFLITAAKTERCNLGHKHVIAEAVYRIPTKEEAEPFREYACSYGTHTCRLSGHHEVCSTTE